MTKLKFIALTMFLFSGLLGGVYGSFTDEAVAEVTAQAGTLRVEITEASFPNQGHASIPYLTGGGNVTEDKKSALLWVENLYPTGKNTFLNFQIYIKNVGSLPVRLEQTNGVSFIKKHGPDIIWDNLKGEVHLRLYDANNSFVDGSYKNSGSFTFSEIDTIIENLMEGITLPPDWSVRYSILFWLAPGSQQDNEMQSKTAGFEVQFNWIQCSIVTLLNNH